MATNLKSALGDQPASVKVLDFLIIGIISLIFFVCPLFFTGLVAQGLGFEKMILFYFLVLLGTVAWVTKGIITGELKLKRTPLDWPIMAMLAVFTISTIFSINYMDSLIGSYGNSAKGLAAVFVFALFYYLVVNNINPKRIKLLFWAVVASSSLIIIYSLLQLLGIFALPFAFTKAITFNPLGSSSSLAMFSIIVLPLLVIGAAQISVIYHNLKNKFIIVTFKILLTVIILVALSILALLKGFAFLPAAIVGMVIVLMFLLSKIVKIFQGNLIIPLVVFSALIILLVLGNFNIINLDLPAEVSLSRSTSWNLAKASLFKDPFFGSGPSTFYYSFAKYKSLDFNDTPLWNTRFNNAGGALFELMANVGSLGTLLVVIIILIALSICFITLTKTDNKEIQSILLALLAGFITILIFALLFAVNNSLILFSVLVSCLAISSAITVYPEKFKTVNLSLKASPKYALALSAIFLSISAGVVILFTTGAKMYLADVYAKESLIIGDTKGKIEKLEKAISLAPYQDVYYMNLANHYMNLANQEAAANSKDFQNYLSLAIERGKKAVELSPNKAVNNESLALIYENSSFYIRGALEWAENYYNKVIELDPNNPAPYIRLALIDMARANLETDQSEKEYNIQEAIKKYDKAIEVKTDLAAAYYGKAIAYEKLANSSEAIEQLKKAVITARNNIDYRFELGRLYFNRGTARPDLKQNASQDITVEDIASNKEKNKEGSKKLSVEPDQRPTGIIKRNNDLNFAEQIFLSILQAVPNHANARYSLAVLYKKLGEKEKAKNMVKVLLDILPDDATKQAVKKQFQGLY